jgi:RsiW-degrading membrane proteinase PrsW (M82 family)
MSFEFFLKAPVGLLPALIFLGALVYLDSFRLVSFTTVLVMLLIGGAIASLSYFANDFAIEFLGFDLARYSRYGAPIVEETLKAAAIVYLLSRNQLGFMVDAAIAGLAIGTGFALAESIYQLYVLPDAPIEVWIVRGFGTAIMHGGVTAIFGVLAQSMTEGKPRNNLLLYLPGLVIAIVLHSVFNHIVGSPSIAAIAALVVLPLVLLLVFGKSEHRVHDWLLRDYESHEHLLEDIDSGAYARSEAGRFVAEVVRRFDQTTAADIFDYIKLHTQLVLRAEQILLAREGGTKLGLSEEDRDHFQRLHMLERKIGRTAMLVLWPHLHFSRQELWELHHLERSARHNWAAKKPGLGKRKEE